MAETKLTAKQERFCEEYMVDMNATQASIRSGYSEKTAKQIGTENLAKPAIMDKLAKLKAELSAKTLVDAEYVVKGLLEVHRRCMQEEAVVDSDGPTGEYKFEHSGANRSLELLGKHIGMFATKLDVRSVELTHEQWLESLE